MGHGHSEKGHWHFLNMTCDLGQCPPCSTPPPRPTTPPPPTPKSLLPTVLVSTVKLTPEAEVVSGSVIDNGGVFIPSQHNSEADSFGYAITV